MQNVTATALWDLWRLILRLTMGFYWLYFSSQKWFGIEWVHALLVDAAQNHPISAMRILLTEIVIPNWEIITVTQTLLEAAIGILLLIGFVTKAIGVLSALLSFELLVAFMGSLDAPAFIWFYVLSAMTNFTLTASDAGRVFGLDGFLSARSHDQ
jgi:uncharacterized membrane protein YphA (DoxX/SURF4 family)